MMRLGIILALMFATCSSISAMRLYAHIKYDNYRSSEAGAWLKGAESGEPEERAPVDVELAKLEDISRLPLVHAGAFNDVARGRTLRAMQVDDADIMLSELCFALSAEGKALALKPFHSAYLINWANLRQMLGMAQCEAEYTSGSFVSSLQFALKKDPTNIKTAYSGAVVELWAGRREEALKLFAQVLRYSTSTSEGQRRLIFSVLREPSDVLSVVPARLPQARIWAELYRQYDPVGAARVSYAFGKLQQEGIAALMADSEKGLVDADVLYEELMSLIGKESSEEARIALDKSLGAFLPRNGSRTLGKFFTERSQLRKLAVVRAYQEGDTRPLRSPLANWTWMRDVTLNSFYTTVGFTTESASKVRLIQVIPERAVNPLQISSLKIFASKDNSSWVDLTPLARVRSESVAKLPLISISVQPDESLRFWKLHFSSSEREGTFSGPIDRLLQVYGDGGSLSPTGEEFNK